MRCRSTGRSIFIARRNCALPPQNSRPRHHHHHHHHAPPPPPRTTVASLAMTAGVIFEIGDGAHLTTAGARDNSRPSATRRETAPGEIANAIIQPLPDSGRLQTARCWRAVAVATRSRYLLNIVSVAFRLAVLHTSHHPGGRTTGTD
jgi:hypothetical protein